MDTLTKKSFTKLRDPRRDQKAFNELEQLKVETDDEMMEEEGELQEKFSPKSVEEERPRARSESPLNPQEIARRIHALYSEILEGGDLSAVEISHLLLETINLESQLEKIQEKRSHLLSEMEKMEDMEKEKIREIQGLEMDQNQDSCALQVAPNFYSKTASMLGGGDTLSPYSNATAASLPDFYLADPVEWTKGGPGSGTTASDASPAAGNLSFVANSSSFLSGETFTKQDENPSFPELSGRITSMLGRIVEEFPIIKQKTAPVNMEEGLEGEQEEESTVTTPPDLLSMFIQKPSKY